MKKCDLRRNQNDVVVLDTKVNVEQTSSSLQDAIDSLNNTGNTIVKVTDHGYIESMKSIKFNLSDFRFHIRYHVRCYVRYYV